MSEALLAIMGKRFGCAGVVDADGRLTGIITNGGDAAAVHHLQRRAREERRLDGDRLDGHDRVHRPVGEDLLHRPVDAIMTVEPITVEPALFASAALEMMNSLAVSSMRRGIRGTARLTPRRRSGDRGCAGCRWGWTRS
jgi:arabinose-5-phosphate isomerase